eukprot:15504-Amphidinium_carterae.1
MRNAEPKYDIFVDGSEEHIWPCWRAQISVCVSVACGSRSRCGQCGTSCGVRLVAAPKVDKGLRRRKTRRSWKGASRGHCTFSALAL